MSDADDWARVRELFHAALDLPADARLAFVTERAGDPRVADEVMSLLDAYPAAEAFLDAPADTTALAAAVAQLHPGDRLGAFEVVDLIGAGGMGEIYRARDMRLGREVAIKVLSGAFETAAGRTRLEREARAVAALAHDRIVRLHDVGVASVGGVEVTYLVMELADGETLAARLRRGALPVDQALGVAIDVADALVAAHTAGIVHRDLKPANVMLTKSGAKLLDFGLARLRSTAQVPAEGVSAAAATVPTTHSAAFGTPAYMAPEQLRGAVADARSDLFAFGAMLHEMVSGRRAFDAESPQGLVTAILEQEPAPLSTLVASVPPALDRLVATCLAKDPDERWQTAKDLLRDLRWVRSDLVGAPALRESAPRPVSRSRAVVAALAVAAVTALVVVAGTRALTTAPSPPARVSFSIPPPEGTQFPRGAAEMAISPDSTRLVFVALSRDGQRHLWMRRFDGTDSKLVPGTEDAHTPFWSPDGRSIAFFTHGQLNRIGESGGVPQRLCDVRLALRGGAWNRDGVIVFSAFGQPLMRVADTGGTPIPVTSLAPPWLEHTWPVFLADGRRFLFLARNQDPSAAAIFEGSLASPDTRRVFAAEAPVSVSGDSLLTLSKGLLAAQRYDAGRAQLTGSPVTIAEGVASDPPQRSGASVAVAPGVVAFRSASPDSRLAWFDRAGVERAAFPVKADYHHPSLAPDDARAAIEKTDPGTGRHTIWILDFLRGTTSRLLRDATGAHNPLWTPDGRHIVFNSNRLGGVDVYRIGSDGASDEEVLVSSQEGGLLPTDVSLDGRFLLYQIRRRGQEDLMVLSLHQRRGPAAYAETPADEHQGRFSPDGRWIAYASTETGAPEVYVRSFPAAGGQRQISTRGGAQPQWRRDGKELFFLGVDGKLMAMAVSAGPTGIRTGTPRELFDTGIVASLLDRRNHYAVTKDGQRFLVNLSAEDKGSAPITVVMNWNAAYSR